MHRIVDVDYVHKLVMVGDSWRIDNDAQVRAQVSNFETYKHFASDRDRGQYQGLARFLKFF